MKKLGTKLLEIANAKGDRTELINQVSLDIKGHQEEKLLSECLSAAIDGKTYIRWDRKQLPPPASLSSEGFSLTNGKYKFE